jgi:hypothetical protein
VQLKELAKVEPLDMLEKPALLTWLDMLEKPASLALPVSLEKSGSGSGDGAGLGEGPGLGERLPNGQPGVPLHVNGLMYAGVNMVRVRCQVPSACFAPSQIWRRSPPRNPQWMVSHPMPGLGVASAWLAAGAPSAMSAEAAARVAPAAMRRVQLEVMVFIAILLVCVDLWY